MSDKKRENIIEIYSKTFISLAEIRPKNITVSLSIKMSEDSIWFYITVFNKSYDNVTFNLYDFQDIEYLESMAKSAVESIKIDDFGLVKDAIKP